MSRILRRPMFRGGPASSEGVGITSGLNQGYANGGNVIPKRGLVDGPGGYAGDLIPYQAPNPIINSAADIEAMAGTGTATKTGTAAETLESGLMSKFGKKIGRFRNMIPGLPASYTPAVAPFVISFLGTNYLSNLAQEEFNKLSPTEKTNFIKYAKQFGEAPQDPMGSITGVGEYTPDSSLPPDYQPPYSSKLSQLKHILFGDVGDYLVGGEKKPTLKEDSNLKENLYDQDKSITKINKVDNSQTLKKDIDTYTKLLMENAGPDKDEYTRQKYLTLAKFGLNLLKPTPVGIKPSLTGSIASAAEKPLEEYGNIAMQQSKEDRALRQAAVQLGIQKNMPGNIAKGIQDLMAMNPNMTAEEATNIITTQKNAVAMAKEKFIETTQREKDISNMVQSDPALKKLSKVNPNFALDYAKIAVEQGLYKSELKGLAADYNPNSYQPNAIYFAPDKKTGELLPHKFINGKFYSIREPEFKKKGI
jgi:hypothetical protein